MNPAWELLPFNQLCRTLARRSGRSSEEYSTWTREKIKQALERYEVGQSPTSNGAITPEQLQSIKDGLNTDLKLRADEIDLALDRKSQVISENLNVRFTGLRTDIIESILSIRRVERETIVVRKTNDEVRETNLGRQHRDFSNVLAFLSTRQNVFLVGPAGSGKTSGAQQAAKALDQPFYFNGAIDSEYKLLGFIDAQGRVVHRPFRQAWEHGGVYLFDEVDASLPSALLAFNAALSNDICDFPDGVIPRHKDFYCLAAGNTFYGADHQYVGRFKQDGAFLDRFLVLDWHYDLDLEKELGLNLWPESPFRALSWFNMIVKTREQAALKGLQVIISPRATIGGIKLLRSGVSWTTSVRVTLRKTMKGSDWDKIMEFTEEPPAAKEAAERESLASWESYVPAPPVPEPEPEQYFHVKSHGKTHRKFYNDLL